MKEKYILYILIILTVITNSNCFPATQSAFTHQYDEDPNDVIAYWTPENMKDTIPVTGEDGSSEETSSEKVYRPDNDAVGKLFFFDSITGYRYSCTASVIDTDDGNIGLTAAHCLYKCYDQKVVYYTKMLFCPGYNNNDNNGCTGTAFSVPVSYSATITTDCSHSTDYGMIKFHYDGDGNLEDRTKYLQWNTSPGVEIDVTVYGYPVDGEIEQCAKNGEELCSWHGESYSGASSIRLTSSDVRYINVNTGHGSSGGPWIYKDRVIAIVSRVAAHYTESPLFVYAEFFKLIRSLSVLN